jgi:hypothetical protein
MKEGMSQKDKKELNARITEISAQLKNKTTVLCRNLRDSPNISENLKKIQTEVCLKI